ncbi:hypothetical protein UlMin_039761 [Ulmus minor]
MGKRSTVVVVSSDDEGDRSLCSRARRRGKSGASSTVPRANTVKSKKPRLSGSRSISRKESGDWDEIRLFCEDFDEKVSGLKVSAGSGGSIKKELWVEKYKPCSLEELAVHKKKVEDVKVWFEERLRTTKVEFSNHVLVITGQAGVGKSATVHVIASHLGARLCEWNTPTPIIWQEHLYNSNAGMHYSSKLDEFENFVERIRKYRMIPSSDNEESKDSNILLIDDLPVTNGKVAFGRLSRALCLLAHSICIPTAILFTNYGEADSADQATRYLEELQLSLENAGACKVSFNPITHNSIKKVLSRICRQEHCNVSAEQIDLLAKASGGDIRHAITSLQFFSLKPRMTHPLSPSSGGHTFSKEKPEETDTFNVGCPLQFGRDETLSLFHALGKFLHNKRETEIAMESVGDEFVVREELSRLPLKMDAPEKILCQAHGQARPIADFLNENVLDFLTEEAIDDAWNVASYLGDADLLLSSFRGMLTRSNEVENVLQSAAASVAARGVLFGNSHPAPSRWHSIRRPELWQVEQSLLRNKKEMVKRRYDAYNGTSTSNLTVIATEFTPLLKWLEFRAPGDLESHNEALPGSGEEDRNIKMVSLEEQECMISEDEIEEW